MRLGLIESFGTGIARIKESYESSLVKPSFRVTPNSVTVVLPVLAEKTNLNKDQEKIFSMLTKTRTLSATELAEQGGFSKSKVLRILSALIKQGLASTIGSGRSTKYLRA